MCFGVTCSTCSKATWRGCGAHIPAALSGVPEDQWCTCTPKVTVNGKDGLLSRGSSNDKAAQGTERRDEL
ncbi:uncharacterized protein LY79DRAFT_547213 [Colletotrichum navitas]|uniref:Uncharacterized protein n=1 Tax=Colletotrichum navitas TaxID=681940 RepID=A0AAD8Q3Q9_9PEZI|nr:uncharacterized protein LY79DRAFT_547213 [Colletotrichum navitas]KAK1595268.1 hypothetical protein LY79DRAFT_547213 [Colletotrichum navitas]